MGKPAPGPKSRQQETRTTTKQHGPPTYRKGSLPMKSYTITREHMEHLAVFRFGSDELRGIAAALGHEDAGARELLAAADELDALDLEAVAQ